MKQVDIKLTQPSLSSVDTQFTALVAVAPLKLYKTIMIVSSSYNPAPRWQNLNPELSDPVVPASFPRGLIRYRNDEEATRIGLEKISPEDWIKHFAQFEPLPENLKQPLALRYHGHQFTHYNPNLGDGRGFLFAQVKVNDKLLDLGTKGSGKTPWSRQGDGRLTLKGGVREVLATTFLESLGVNTSKSFSLIETGESLKRSDEPSPTRSSVLVRLSHSHVRIGSFQRLAFLKERKLMKELLDYCLAELYPGIQAEDFFEQVCQKVALTTAQWMVHGFVHGVLNTDNINITGESFDYGPYRFLPHYDPSFTAAYFDHQGLYAFGRQPSMVFWNLERLSEALSLLDFPKTSFAQGLQTYKQEFNHQLLTQFSKKLGLAPHQEGPELQNFFYTCLQFMEKSKAPFQAFHNHLYCWHQDLNVPLNTFSPFYKNSSEVEDIESQLVRFQRDPLAPEKNPGNFQDLLIDDIEILWSAIEGNDDWSLFDKKLQALRSKD